jgi:hypothetical protein
MLWRGSYMKKVILMLVLVAVLAVSAQALTVSDLTVGSDSQARIHNVSKTITITNTDNATALTGLTFTTTAPSSYDVRFTNVPASIAAGETVSITMAIDIPDNHNAIDNDYNEVALKVGTVTARGNLGGTIDTKTVDLKVQAENHGKINKIRSVCDIDGEGTKSTNLDDGDRIKNLIPGTECTLEVEIENTFDDRSDKGENIYDIEMDSVDFAVDSSNRDVDADFDDDEITGVPADDEDNVDLTIVIEDDADSDSTLTIYALFTDDNGAQHGEKWTIKVEVEREKYDIKIRTASASPTTMTNCNDKTVQVTINLKNMGKRDEDEAAVEINVADLGFTDKQTDIQLDKDDSRTVSFTIPVPKGVKAQLYTAELKTFFDTIAPSNLGKVDFTVTECPVGDKTEETEENKTTVVVKEDITTPNTENKVVVPSSKSAATAAPKKEGFSESNAYIALLASLSVLLVVAIVLAIVLFARKKK